ncbi:MAG: hypothetical protein ACN4GZ_09200 [Acidimicrobiales bacterium]
MATTIVRYTTAEGRADENQALIETVFEQLASVQPEGLKYMSSRVGNDFLHVAVLPDDGTNPLAELSAFVEFTSDIAERCDVPPNAQPGAVVGTYGFGR